MKLFWLSTITLLPNAKFRRPLADLQKDLARWVMVKPDTRDSWHYVVPDGVTPEVSALLLKRGYRATAERYVDEALMTYATREQKLARIAALLRAPNEDNWSSLAAILSVMEMESGFSEVFAQCARALETWPDRLRETQEAWIENKSQLVALCRSFYMSELGTVESPVTMLRGGLRENASAVVDRLSAVTKCAGVRGGTVEKLQQLGVLERLTHLDLETPTLQDLELVVKHAPRLERLMLSGGDLGQAGLDLLAQSPLRLTHLVMSDQALKGAKAGKSFATSPVFENLQYLDLEDNSLTDAFVKPFVARVYSGLTYLGLASVKMTQVGLDMLSSSAKMPALEGLNLRSACRVPVAMAAVATSGNFPKLRRLNSRGLRPSADDVVAFLESDGLPALEHLLLSGNFSVDALVPRLPEQLKSPLRQLHLGGPATKDLSWERLSWMNDLETLHIPSVLQEGAVAAFLERAPIANLKALDLTFANLKNDGARQLAAVPFNRLRELKIDKTNIFLDSAESLLNAKWFGQLNALKVDDDQWAVEGLNALHERTHVRVIFDIMDEFWMATKWQWFDPPNVDAKSTALPLSTEKRAVAQVVARVESVRPAVATEKEGAKEVLAHLREILTTSFGAGVIVSTAWNAGQQLVIDGGAWKLAVLVGRYTGSRSANFESDTLEDSERTNLFAEAFVRIPTIERALFPDLTDAEYTKLPFVKSIENRPTLTTVLVDPKLPHWDLESVGGALRAAKRIEKQLATWLPLLSSPRALATFAALQSTELRGSAIVAELGSPVPNVWPVRFAPGESLVAAVGFLQCGDVDRAAGILANWAARPKLAEGAKIYARIGTTLTDAQEHAAAVQVGKLLSASGRAESVVLPAPAPEPKLDEGNLIPVLEDVLRKAFKIDPVASRTGNSWYRFTLDGCDFQAGMHDDFRVQGTLCATETDVKVKTLAAALAKTNTALESAVFGGVRFDEADCYLHVRVACDPANASAQKVKAMIDACRMALASPAAATLKMKFVRR